MTLLQAFILGVVQGLTEFLPVSSSGHLVIAQEFMGLQTAPIFFDVVVHLGTLVAVFVYFAKRLVAIRLPQVKLALVATIPAVIAGLFIQSYIEILFNSLWIVSMGLLYTGALLLLAHQITHSSKKIDEASWRDVGIIGLFQALAIVPGISRSGSTVYAGLLRGLKREDAFFFSFLLSIPVILGAGVLQLKDITAMPEGFLEPTLIGFITSAITGLGALKLLELMVVKAKLHFFGYYCISLSVGILLYQIFL